MIYFCCFLTVIALTNLYERSSKTVGNKILHNVLGLIIVLIPSLLGGLRDVTVGTDNMVYRRLFLGCFSRSLKDAIVFSQARFGEIEKGFVVFVWLISRLGNNYAIFTFSTSLLTFSLFFLGLKNYQDRFSITLMMMVYLFIFYCPLYNYVRQGIALSIIFYSWKFAQKKQPFKFFIATIIASSMHVSAIAALLIYIIIYYRGKFGTYTNTIVMCIISIFVLSIGPPLIYNILIFLSKQGIRSEIVLLYASKVSNVQHYNFFSEQIFVRSVPQLILFIVFYKKLVSFDDTFKGYYLMCWVQFFLTFIGMSLWEPIARLALYFNYSELMLFPGLVKCTKSRKQKLLFIVGIFLYCVTYWFVFTVLNYDGFTLPVYPYTSWIL